MDGLGRSIGCGNFIDLADECALMRPLTLGLLGVCENHILSIRKTPLDIILQTNHSESDDLTKRAVEDMKRDRHWRVVTAEDIQKWLYTIDGIAFTAWLCLRKRHSLATSPVRIRTHFFGNPTETHDFVRRRDICSGIDLLASLDWIEPKHPFPEKQKETPRPKFMPWRRIIHDIAENAQILPHELAKLTLYTFRIITTEANSPLLGGTATVSAADAKLMMKMTREEKCAYIASLKEDNDGK